MNNVVLIGRLTRDPELRYIPVSGRAVCNFSLAIDKGLSREKRQEMEAKNQPTADFINIVVWGNMAENCAKYLAKGLLTAVQGRLQSRSYDDKDGKRVFVVEVVANNVEFLEWGDPKETPGQYSDNPAMGNNYQNQGQQDYSGPQNDFGNVSGFHTASDTDDIPF